MRKRYKIEIWIILVELKRAFSLGCPSSSDAEKWRIVYGCPSLAGLTAVSASNSSASFLVTENKSLKFSAKTKSILVAYSHFFKTIFSLNHTIFACLIAPFIISIRTKE